MRDAPRLSHLRRAAPGIQRPPRAPYREICVGSRHLYVAERTQLTRRHTRGEGRGECCGGAHAVGVCRSWGLSQRFCVGSRHLYVAERIQMTRRHTRGGGVVCGGERRVKWRGTARRGARRRAVRRGKRSRPAKRRPRVQAGTASPRACRRTGQVIRQRVPRGGTVAESAAG